MGKNKSCSLKSVSKTNAARSANDLVVTRPDTLSKTRIRLRVESQSVNSKSVVSSSSSTLIVDSIVTSHESCHITCLTNITNGSWKPMEHLRIFWPMTHDSLNSWQLRTHDTLTVPSSPMPMATTTNDQWLMTMPMPMPLKRQTWGNHHSVKPWELASCSAAVSCKSGGSANKTCFAKTSDSWRSKNVDWLDRFLLVQATRSPSVPHFSLWTPPSELNKYLLQSSFRSLSRVFWLSDLNHRNVQNEFCWWWYCTAPCFG